MNRTNVALALRTAIVAAALSGAGCMKIDSVPPGGGFGATVENPYGDVVAAAKAPPPVSGGTLLALRDGRTAIAADPDRDFVSIVDVQARKVTGKVTLKAHDEPGRSVEDGAGRVHVVLRGTGEVVSFDPGAGSRPAQILERRPVCATARGIAVHRASGDLLVACMSGDLMRLPVSGGVAEVAVHLDGDLRDIVVTDAKIFVTRFRSAEIITLDENLLVLGRTTLPSFTSQAIRSNATFVPTVAWRAVAVPGTQQIAVMHQRSQSSQVGPVVTQAYYTEALGFGSSSRGSAIVHGTLSLVGGDGPMTASPVLASAVLPVDVAISPDGQQVAIADAGNVRPLAEKTPNVFQAALGQFATKGFDRVEPIGKASTLAIQAIAVAYTPGGQLLVQSREPARLYLGMDDAGIELSSESVADTGHLIFHSTTGDNFNIACASCHAEGGDDGHTWFFAEGKRRTPPLRGGISQRAPYHWDGAETTMGVLATDVFSTRMSGPALGDRELGALGGWLDTVPHLPAQGVTNAAAVARGQLVYQQAECATCHTEGAPQFSNVTTGGHFKAPSLRSISLRLPAMHDGCATTLAQRFDPACGGGDSHGKTSALSAGQTSDLIAFLESL